MLVAGIDPGKTGAMVTLFEDGSTVVDRVPLVKTPTGRVRPNYEEWARGWQASISFSRPDVFMLELVEARPGQGVTSMFNFGKTLGFAMGVIMCSGIPVHQERPNVWKAKLGLVGFDKAASVALARKLVPSIVPELDSKRRGNTADVRHGIAEAALLSYYGLMTIAAT